MVQSAVHRVAKLHLPGIILSGIPQCTTASAMKGGSGPPQGTTQAHGTDPRCVLLSVCLCAHVCLCVCRLFFCAWMCVCVCVCVRVLRVSVHPCASKPGVIPSGKGVGS